MRTLAGVFASLLIIPQAWAIPINLESGITGTTYVVEGEVGTAGTLGVDYTLGTYVAGGGALGHGFGTSYSFHTGHFTGTPPSGTTAAGAMEAVDHNWLQGTRAPIVVDLGAGQASNQAIVFNSIDHLGVNTTYGVAEQDLWNAVNEGIEFTVWGTNDLADATAAAGTNDVFGSGLSGPEAGAAPGAGVGSTFEAGALDYVFLDGWLDHGNAQEGDDYASVWQFTQNYQYIAVYSNFTDPFIGDGFRSFDNELDAIGSFLTPVGDEPIPEPGTLILMGTGLLGFAAMARRKRR